MTRPAGTEASSKFAKTMLATVGLLSELGGSLSAATRHALLLSTSRRVELAPIKSGLGGSPFRREYLVFAVLLGGKGNWSRART